MRCSLWAVIGVGEKQLRLYVGCLDKNVHLSNSILFLLSRQHVYYTLENIRSMDEPAHVVKHARVVRIRTAPCCPYANLTTKCACIYIMMAY